MLKKLWVLLSLVLVASMLLVGCGGGGAGDKLKVGMITDAGGIDDKSFNATSWKGVEEAVKELKIDGSYLESKQQTDYATNL
ncbi:MAG: BMP family ABC transporter substrate-binding protein, partial [Anaerolineae bacterium]|nr:BMP family ABC transporter substrate-binding protein [Anaerolineae bacterium]